MARLLKTMKEAKPSAFLVISTLACLVPFSMQACDRPTNLQDNVVIEPDEPSYETWYAYKASCETGYTVVGETNFYCSHGDPGDYWFPNPSSTTCNAMCSKPDYGDPDLIFTPDEPFYEQNSGILFSCVNEGDISGSESATCTPNATWHIVTEPSCSKSCIPPANSNGTGQYGHNVFETFACDSGFDLFGESTTQCVDGEWSPAIQCIEREGCEAPPNQPSVKYTFPPNDGDDLYAIHSMLEMQCMGQRNAWGPLYSYCNETNQWEPDPLKLKCYDKCGKPTFDDTRVTVTSMHSGRTDDEYYDHTDTVKFSCPGGIFVDGPWRASCKNGTWSTSIGGYRPVCRENCTAPDNTLNAGELFQHGQAYTFQCDPAIPGLVRLGGPRAFCNDGTWKPNLKCRLKTEL